MNLGFVAVNLNFTDICIRLLIAMAFGGIIGWEREFKSRPAGLRTHILVCLGATIVAMIQNEIMLESLQIGMQYPKLGEIIRSDPARLICQVVCGIGFLGAGTIVVTKNTVHGLTTAASLWATAILGIAIGMGYYVIAVAGAVFIFFALTVVKKIQDLPSTVFPVMKRIEIEYHHGKTKEFIQNYFASHKIKICSKDFSIHFDHDLRVYTDDYTIELPKGVTYIDIAEDLTQEKNITLIHLVNL